MMKKTITIIFCVLGIIALYIFFYYFCIIPNHYEEIDIPTPNITKGKNKVDGVVLHHTATFTPKQSILTLTTPSKKVSCHVLISYDGTRYIFANPRQITRHAGRSYFKGKNNVNRFMIGIEFQGCTSYFPLTNRQIASAVEYLKPILKKYDIPIENIVTHKMIRDEWIKRHPNDGTPTKPDIAERDYKRVIKSLININNSNK